MKPIAILIALAGAGVMLAQAPPPPGCLQPPAVKSMLPTDTIISNQVNFDCFGWQEFIALTWKAGKAGQPDPSAKPADYGIPNDPSPLVWETYMLDTQVFLPNAAKPAGFGSATASLPSSCQVTTGARMLLEKNARGLHILSMTSKFDDATQQQLASIGQAGTAGSWLTAQNKNLVYYEIRMNEDEYNYIVQNGFYNAVNQGTAMQNGSGIDLPVAGASYGPSGAVEVKAAWLEITDQSLWPQYRMIQALILDYTKNPPVCRVANMGLVGLHIIHKTPNAQQMAWATFEHVNNAPTKPPPSAGTFTFFNPQCNPQTDYYKCVTNAQPQPCDPKNPLKPCSPYTAPVQVLRVSPIESNAQTVNAYTQYYIRQANPKSVFQNYQLVSVLWPLTNTVIKKTAMVPLYDGNPQPPKTQGGLVNTTLETYFQGGTGSNPQQNCTDCHVYGQIAKQPGTIQCTVTTIQGQTPPGPCATSYSFLFGEATCPKGVSCGTQQMLFQVKRRAAQLHAQAMAKESKTQK
jgi:hypothetical protein